MDHSSHAHHGHGAQGHGEQAHGSHGHGGHAVAPPEQAHAAHHDHANHVDHGAHAGHADHSAHAGHGAPAGHGAHAGHAATAARGWSSVSWAMAAQATLHCLIGCAIGEVLGMVIGTALGLSTVATVALAVGLAFVFGYALTMRGVLRAGVPWRTALKVALAADTVSIAVMEVLDNAVMVTVPGAMEAGLTSGLFWGALAFSFLVAFVLTTPLNRWMISRGRGHAVVHAYHH